MPSAHNQVARGSGPTGGGGRGGRGGRGHGSGPPGGRGRGSAGRGSAGRGSAGRGSRGGGSGRGQGGGSIRRSGRPKAPPPSRFSNSPSSATSTNNVGATQASSSSTAGRSPAPARAVNPIIAGMFNMNTAPVVMATNIPVSNNPVTTGRVNMDALMEASRNSPYPTLGSIQVAMNQANQSGRQGNLQAAPSEPVMNPPVLEDPLIAAANAAVRQVVAESNVAIPLQITQPTEDNDGVSQLEEENDGVSNDGDGDSVSQNGNSQMGNGNSQMGNVRRTAVEDDRPDSPQDMDDEESDGDMDDFADGRDVIDRAIIHDEEATTMEPPEETTTTPRRFATYNDEELNFVDPITQELTYKNPVKVSYHNPDGSVSNFKIWEKESVDNLIEHSGYSGAFVCPLARVMIMVDQDIEPFPVNEARRVRDNFYIRTGQQIPLDSDIDSTPPNVRRHIAAQAQAQARRQEVARRHVRRVRGGDDESSIGAQLEQIRRRTSRTPALNLEESSSDSDTAEFLERLSSRRAAVSGRGGRANRSNVRGGRGHSRRRPNGVITVRPRGPQNAATLAANAATARARAASRAEANDFFAAAARATAPVPAPVPARTANNTNTTNVSTSGPNRVPAKPPLPGPNTTEGPAVCAAVLQHFKDHGWEHTMAHGNLTTYSDSFVLTHFQPGGILQSYNHVAGRQFRSWLKKFRSEYNNTLGRPGSHSGDSSGALGEDVLPYLRLFHEFYEWQNSRPTANALAARARVERTSVEHSLAGAQAPLGPTGARVSLRTETTQDRSMPTGSQDIGDLEVTTVTRRRSSSIADSVNDETATGIGTIGTATRTTPTGRARIPAPTNPSRRVTGSRYSTPIGSTRELPGRRIDNMMGMLSTMTNNVSESIAESLDRRRVEPAPIGFTLGNITSPTLRRLADYSSAIDVQQHVVQRANSGHGRNEIVAATQHNILLNMCDNIHGETPERYRNRRIDRSFQASQDQQDNTEQDTSLDVEADVENNT